MEKGIEQTRKAEGAQFLRYFGPLSDALRALGGSGTPEEVVERIALDLGLSDEAQDDPLRRGNHVFETKLLGPGSISSGRGSSTPQDVGSGV